MAYDEGLAQRLREVLGDRTDVVEKRMFGGLAFMVRGHMCCAVSGQDLMVRAGPDQYEALLSLPHASPMDITSRPMRGFVIVGPAGLSSMEDLKEWVNRGLEFVCTLPSK